MKDVRARVADDDGRTGPSAFVLGLLPLGLLLSGERRAAGVAGVRLEPKVARHVEPGFG